MDTQSNSHARLYCTIHSADSAGGVPYSSHAGVDYRSDITCYLIDKFCRLVEPLLLIVRPTWMASRLETQPGSSSYFPPVFVLLPILVVPLLGSCQNHPSPEDPPAQSALLKRRALLERENPAGSFVRLEADDCGIEFRNDVFDPVLQQQEIHLQSGLATGDFDDDGDLDIFLLGLQSPNRFYRNDGGMHFTDITAELGEGLDGDENLGSSAHFVDLTGDGRLDLLVCNRVAPNQFFRQVNRATLRYRTQWRARHCSAR